jgi:hypothetical protein
VSLFWPVFGKCWFGQVCRKSAAVVITRSEKAGRRILPAPYLRDTLTSLNIRRKQEEEKIPVFAIDINSDTIHCLCYLDCLLTGEVTDTEHKQVHYIERYSRLPRSSLQNCYVTSQRRICEKTGNIQSLYRLRRLVIPNQTTSM